MSARIRTSPTKPRTGATNAAAVGVGKPTPTPTPTQTALTVAPTTTGDEVVDRVAGLVSDNKRLKQRVSELTKMLGEAHGVIAGYEKRFAALEEALALSSSSSSLVVAAPPPASTTPSPPPTLQLSSPRAASVVAPPTLVPSPDVVPASPAAARRPTTSSQPSSSRGGHALPPSSRTGFDSIAGNGLQRTPAHALAAATATTTTTTVGTTKKPLVLPNGGGGAPEKNRRATASSSAAPAPAPVASLSSDLFEDFIRPPIPAAPGQSALRGRSGAAAGAAGAGGSDRQPLRARPGNTTALVAVDKNPATTTTTTKTSGGDTRATPDDPLAAPRSSLVAPPPRTGRVFVETVRRKSDRAKLDASACPECAVFYKELGEQFDEDPAVLMRRFGRHRHSHTPPGTPDNFWDVWSLPPDSDPRSPARGKRAASAAQPTTQERSNKMLLSVLECAEERV